MSKKRIALRVLSLSIMSIVLVIVFNARMVQLTPDEKDFIYLSRILKQQTRGIDDVTERLRIMTHWLHDHVTSGEYPPQYNPKGVANVIRTGLGNCGFQACNIVCFAELLGLTDHQLIHSRTEWGAPGIHTFAEIWIDDRWIIFDPDKWLYIENNTGELVGIIDIITDTSSITNKEAARWIFSTIQSEGNRVTPSWQETPLPFGRDAYFHFEQCGLAYIYFRKLSENAIKIIVQSLLLFGAFQLLLLMNKKRASKLT